jgi:hypothetical protein
MRRHKPVIALAALVAALALGAVASASASAALPEFVHGEGESFPITFELAKQVGEWTRIEDGAGHGNGLPECSERRFTGQITNGKAVSLTAVLTGCIGAGSACHSVGAKAGEIVIPGTGTLVYLNKAKKEVGIVLHLTKEEATGEEIICGGFEDYLKGSVVFAIGPVNTKTNGLKIRLHGSKGFQETFNYYENEKGEKTHVKFQASKINGPLIEASWNEEGEPTLTTSKSVTIAG